MKIVIASDLHGNLEALAALPREYDQLWILGDLVNYGPNPAEVVEFVRSHASHVVRGNHDHFLGCGEDPRCTGRYQEVAAAAGRFTQSKLSVKDKEYLRDLPLQLGLQVGHTRFWLCHAAPSDPLYAYCPPESERWAEECRRVRADTVLVGHTHIQFHEKVGDCFVANPGSLGQPNNRSALACFAVWQDDSLSLQATLYAVENTVAKVEEMPVPKSVQQDLIGILRSGSLPKSRTEGAKLEKAKGREF